MSHSSIHHYKLVRPIHYSAYLSSHASPLTFYLPSMSVFRIRSSNHHSFTYIFLYFLTFNVRVRFILICRQLYFLLCASNSDLLLLGNTSVTVFNISLFCLLKVYKYGNTHSPSTLSSPYCFPLSLPMVRSSQLTHLTPFTSCQQPYIISVFTVRAKTFIEVLYRLHPSFHHPFFFLPPHPVRLLSELLQLRHITLSHSNNDRSRSLSTLSSLTLPWLSSLKFLFFIPLNNFPFKPNTPSASHSPSLLSLPCAFWTSHTLSPLTISVHYFILCLQATDPLNLCHCGVLSGHLLTLSFSLSPHQLLFSHVISQPHSNDQFL